MERSRAWDNHLQLLRDDVTARYAAKWEARRIQDIERTYTLAAQVRDRALEMLAHHLFETKRDGKVIAPAKWNMGTALDAIRLASELESRSLQAMTPDDLASLTVAELRAIQESGHRAISEILDRNEQPDPPAWLLALGDLGPE